MRKCTWAPEEREAIQKIISDGQNQMRKVIQGLTAGNPRTAHAGTAQTV